MTNVNKLQTSVHFHLLYTNSSFRSSTRIGLPLVLLLGSFGPTWHLVGNLVLVIFTVHVLFDGAILCWTGYSCQNKRQNALFWARKLKKISEEGAQPNPIGEENTPPQASPPRRLAPYLPTPQLFFHNSHTDYRYRVGAHARYYRYYRTCTGESVASVAGQAAADEWSISISTGT